MFLQLLKYESKFFVMRVQLFRPATFKAACTKHCQSECNKSKRNFIVTQPKSTHNTLAHEWSLIASVYLEALRGGANSINKEPKRHTYSKPWQTVILSRVHYIYDSKTPQSHWMLWTWTWWLLGNLEKVSVKCLL